MLESLDITEEDAAGLAELGRVHLTMAREFAARAQVVDDPELACKLAAVSQRHGRAFRQNLAMKLRLKRELMALARETPAPPVEVIRVPRDAQRIKARAEALRTPLQRLVWSEHDWTERPETEDDDVAGCYFNNIEARLERLARDNTFGLKRLDEHTLVELPLDEHVALVARDLALDEIAAPRWRDLPDPPPEAFIDWPDEDEDTS